MEGETCSKICSGAIAAANDETKIHASPATWARFFESMISFLAAYPLHRTKMTE
jgi:hypothetical protein